MLLRFLFVGFGIWLAATIALRLFGQSLLHPGNGPGTVILFAISFGVVAWFVRRLCRRLEAPAEQWPAAAIWLLLPTLLLDPFSSAFFATVFPNIQPEAAGLFGGWMLICCAGGLVGAIVRR
ncbi:MAG: DUF5367 family protein [Bryobacteraceae bacterium]